MKTAKIFKSGRSQAVRLPAEFRFQGREVFIRRDEKTGDVILSKHDRPSRERWEEIFAQLNAAQLPDDFLSPEDRKQGTPPDRVNF